MAPTSEERREVAERLRDEAGGFRRLEKEWGHEPTIDLGDVTAVFQDVAHFAGLDGTVRTCVLLDRLADLIDPTCKNKADELNRMAPLEMRTDNFICSACGETFCADPDGVNFPIDWAYCPNCGARVERE